jgi:hypothetical protein
MKRSVLLNLLFAVVLAFMLLPEIQRRFNIFEIRALEGAFELSQRPVFTWTTFFSGSWQQQTDGFVEERVGFRPLLVRVRNQMDFMLYNKANAEGVIIAKKGVIIEEDYILEYLGRLFIGSKTVDKKLERTKLLQDTLARKGIHLAIVFEPGKASFHADLIPQRYRPRDKSISNYEYFTEKCRMLGVNHLDLNRYFVDLKPHANYPLYPKYGTHWSMYGMTLAADTLVKYVQMLCGKPLNHMKTGEIRVNSHLWGTDFDGGQSMNLLWKPHTGKMAYPQIGFDNYPDRHQPMVLVIADSYYWNIYNTALPDHLFANKDFWYYNHLVYPDHYEQGPKVDQLDQQAEVEKQEVILVMITERFLYTAFWDFTDDLFRIYYPEYPVDHLYEIGNRIRRDRNWFGLILNEARKRNTTVEEMVQEHAALIYLNEFQSFSEPSYAEYILFYILRIKQDTEWFGSVKKKAESYNIEVDEMLRQDAVWMYEYEVLGMHR